MFARSLTAVVIALSVCSSTAYANGKPTLLRGGTFITYNDKTKNLEIIEDGAMLFDDTILAISKSANGLDSRSNGADVVNTTGKIISPGFIDTHRHTWQTAMRTTGSNVTLASYLWLFGTPGRAATILSPEDIYIAELMGTLEGINGGVTTTLDFAHMTWSREHAEAALKGALDSGGRVVFGYYVGGVTDSGNPFHVDQEAPIWQLKHINELAAKRPFGDGRVTLGISFDGFNFPTTPWPPIVGETAKNLSLDVVMTHDVGGVFGVGLEHTITTTQNLGLLNGSVPYLFVHASSITAGEGDILRDNNQWVSITPESELHYGHGHRYSHLIQDQSALGVDTHFTFSADILTQTRIWLQTVRGKLYQDTLDTWKIPSLSPMTVRQAFLLATRNGGLSIRRPDLGVLKEGAKGDVLVWSTDAIGLIGWSDPIAAIILHSTTADIERVYINGETVKKDFKLVTDFVGKGYATRLRASAEKWLRESARANTSAFERGVKDLYGFKDRNFGDPLLVDVTPGQGTGY